jgi:hypothetical protein
MKAKVFLLLLLSQINGSAQGTWTQKADFGGTARGYAVGFSIGSKGYIGTGDDGAYKKDFWEWDQVNNLWTQMADFGGMAIDNAASFSIGTKGYVCSGYNNGTFYKDLWEWDQSNNTWIQKTSLTGIGRIGAVGFSIGTKGYIATGKSSAGLLNDCWEYDLTNDSWTQKAVMPGNGRFFACGFSIGSNGYVGLGYDGSKKKDFWKFDPIANSWIQITDFPGNPRTEASAFVLGSCSYVGLGWSESFPSAFFIDFWKYDTTDGNWSSITDFPGSNCVKAVAFSISNKGYIGTGKDTTYSNNVKSLWEYCPDCAVSTNEFNLKNSLSVFPNPAKEKIYFEHGFFNGTMHILNTQGQINYLGKFEKELDISFLPAGVYLVEITSGKEKFQTTFIKL